jgi:hypothetical protein
VFGAFFLVVSPFVAVYLLLYYFFQYGEVRVQRLLAPFMRC